MWTRLRNLWQIAGPLGICSIAWTFFWMQFAGLGFFGRIATWLATWFAPPYKDRRRLAHYSSKGYVAPSAVLHHQQLKLGNHIFIGDRTIIFQDRNGGSVELAEGAHLHSETCIQTGEGGSIKIGADTHIQGRCLFSAYKGPIHIGCGVQIASSCAFYPYAHGVAPGELIKRQPLQTKGGILVDDDAWLGHGVVVLDGVRIGKGAVVGAGAVVTRDIPDGAIAAGVPAQVIKLRSDLKTSLEEPCAFANVASTASPPKFSSPLMPEST